MSANCIDVTCDELCARPLYLVLRTATEQGRPYAHAMAAQRIEGVTNYHPSTREAKVNAAFGYDGTVDDQDHAAPKVWAPGGLVLAAWIFAAGVTLWWFKRAWRRK